MPVEERNKLDISHHSVDRCVSIADLERPDIILYDEVRLNRVRVLSVGKVSAAPKSKGKFKGGGKAKDKKGKQKMEKIARLCT